MLDWDNGENIVLENLYKIVMPLFGAAYAAPNKGTAIFNNLGLYQLCKSLQKIVEFKDFSRLWVIFQYFSRQI